MAHSASSRRSAALAIERFYLKRRREPYRSSGARAAASALLLDNDSASSNLLANVDFTSPVDTTGVQLQLIRSTQAKFRARQHRKKAVRVIETAYGEWKFHAEQVHCHVFRRVQLVTMILTLRCVHNLHVTQSFTK